MTGCQDQKDGCGNQIGLAARFNLKMSEAGYCSREDEHNAQDVIHADCTSHRAPRVALKLSDFNIIGRVGDGSFSEVLHVRDKRSAHSYALKMVDKHLIMRHKMIDHIKQERNVLDQCDYAGIARLYFTFQDEASLYLGLELCPNGELYDQIRFAGQLPLSRAIFYAAEIVLMLDYLRGQRVVHRDLKPENLLLTECGHLKLVDFGSVMVLNEQPQERPSGQRSTSLVGTADYLAPEVLSNDPVTYALDLWALGCIIFQMLVGKAPFKAATEYLTFQLIADARFSFPSEPVVPSAARVLISQLLKVDPAERLGAQDLGELQAHPFFEGVDWQTVRETRAPPFSVPQELDTDSSVGLDWEMSSLAASLPVAYQAHEGAPIYHTSGSTLFQRDSLCEGWPQPGVGMHTHSSLVSDVLQPRDSSDTSTTHQQPYAEGSAPGGHQLTFGTWIERPIEDEVSHETWCAHNDYASQKQGSSIKSVSPTHKSEESTELCEAMRASAL